MEQSAPTISVVIPCYKERDHVLGVIAKIPDTIAHIYCVDDKCPMQTGAHIRDNCSDPRVEVIFNERNRGVGGAVMAGYRRALADGCTIIVKMDGDGQMDPALLDEIIRPITTGKADYAKGNRFFMLVQASPQAAISTIHSGLYGSTNQTTNLS